MTVFWTIVWAVIDVIAVICVVKALIMIIKGCPEDATPLEEMTYDRDTLRWMTGGWVAISFGWTLLAFI